MAIEVRSDIYNTVEVFNLSPEEITQGTSGLEEQGNIIANTTTKNQVTELVNKSNSFNNNLIKI